jgi:hypothetical protein
MTKSAELEDLFESDNQRELRQIFTGQSQMFEVLRELNRKLDEVVGRQERTLSLLSSVQAGGAQQGGMLHQVSLVWLVSPICTNFIVISNKNCVSSNFLNV